MYVNFANIQSGSLEELNLLIYKLNEQLNASFGEIEARLQGYTGVITTNNGEKLIFENGILKSEEK